MQRIIKTTLVLSLITAINISCNKDDDGASPSVNTNTLNLNINGLEDLGSDFVYEGWILVNGTPVTTGRFSVSSSGALSQTNFELDQAQLNAATAFILTVEPAVGDDPAPSDVHILAGDFSGSAGTMSVSHPAALGNDFSSAQGKFILATPSTMIMSDENEGLWFLDNSSGSPMEGLNLPTLPSGWVYEGWAIIDGKPISSGRFTSTDMADLDNNPYKGPDGTPPFPGEDYIMGMSNGVDLSLAQHISKAVISIEPMEDNSPAPFTLKPLLSADLNASSSTHTVMDLQQNLTFPTGNFSRQ